MSTKEVVFVGIDGWNRPIFRAGKKDYYGSTDVLFDRDATSMEVLSKISEKDLTYFGTKFGCEPMGTPSGNIKILRISVSDDWVNYPSSDNDIDGIYRYLGGGGGHMTKKGMSSTCFHFLEVLKHKAEEMIKQED